MKDEGALAETTSAPAFTPTSSSLQPRRLHGLQLPFDKLQVISWLLFALSTVVFYTFVGPFLPPPADVACCVVYAVAITMCFSLLFICTHSSASDPGIFMPVEDAILARDTPKLSPQKTPCYLCHAFVDRSSKHCRRCNKCVVGFDHHCKWLNNCVGARNYRLFFTFVSITLGTCIFQCILAVYIFVSTFYRKDHYQNMLRNYLRHNNFSVTQYKVIVGVFSLVWLVASGLLAHLCGFHIMLKFSHLTTYEWILRRRERNSSRLQKPPPLSSVGSGVPAQENAPLEVAPEIQTNHSAWSGNESSRKEDPSGQFMGVKPSSPTILESRTVRSASLDWRSKVTNNPLTATNSHFTILTQSELQTIHTIGDENASQSHLSGHSGPANSPADGDVGGLLHKNNHYPDPSTTEFPTSAIPQYVDSVKTRNVDHSLATSTSYTTSSITTSDSGSASTNVGSDHSRHSFSPRNNLKQPSPCHFAHVSPSPRNLKFNSMSPNETGSTTMEAPSTSTNVARQQPQPQPQPQFTSMGTSHAGTHMSHALSPLRESQTTWRNGQVVPIPLER